MRCLLLNYEFPPMGGGAGRATWNIAKELVQLGHEVDVLTSRLRGQGGQEICEGFTVYRVMCWRKSLHDCGFVGAFVYVVFGSLKFLQLIRKRDYDIVHYFFSLPTGLLTLLAGKHRKIPYIVSLRGSDVPFYDLHNQRLQLAHTLLRPVTTRIWRKAKSVVALSDSLRSIALRTSPEQYIEVIPNGIESELFHPIESTKETDRPMRLICVARLIERKGIQHILAAIAQIRHKDVLLRIVGTGNYEDHLQEVCKQHSLQSVVTFHGYCPRENLPALYNAADVFILTSLAESFGLVFLEAMACGLPVIGGRTGGIVSMIGKENGILVEPGNVDEIKRAILIMRADPECRRRMGLANREKALNEYTWGKIAERYSNIYQSVFHEAWPTHDSMAI